MIVILRPSQPRIFRIWYSPQDESEHKPTDIEASYWQDAVAFWWSGQDVATFDAFADVQIEQGSTLAGLMTLWIDTGNGNWDQLLIQDVTNDVRPIDDVINCAELVERRREERKQRKKRAG